MRIWRVLLRLSVSLHELGDVQAIDATGFKRHQASRHYVLRVGYNFDDIKTTALVDCDTSVILDIHCSMKQPHDTHVGRQVLTRNLAQLPRSQPTKATTGTRSGTNSGMLASAR